MTKAESQPTPGTTRRTIIAGTAAALAAGLAPVIVTTAAADPLPHHFEKFLPVFEEHRRINDELVRRQERAERLGHGAAPLYQYGHAEIAHVLDGDMSDIEEHYARCLIECTSEAQRQHFAWKRDLDLKRARETWEQWDATHRSLGLYDLEEQLAEVEARLAEIEPALWDGKPTTLAGAVALLRYALANARNYEATQDDQPAEARSVAAAIAFLEPLIARAAA